MSPRRADARTRAADPVANPTVRRPLRDPLIAKNIVELLNDAAGKARESADLERTYAVRAELEGDVRGQTAHDLLSQTHRLYADVFVALSRVAAKGVDAA